jgi:hypothetical protein
VSDGVSNDPVDSGTEARSFEVYRLAFEQGVRTLEYQDQQVDTVRDRALKLVTITGAITAFLAGTVLREPPGSRNWLFYVLVVSGTVAFAALSFLAWRILRPIQEWIIEISPATIVQSYGDEDVGLAATYRDLALHTEWSIQENANKVRPILLCYRLSVVAVGVEVIAWVAAAWVFV